MESGKVVLGVLAGVAIGAVLGILLAPEKGSVTRNQILNKGEDFTNDLTRKFDSFIDEASRKYENAIHQAEELSARGKAKFDEIKKEVKNGLA
jgi:gas vesicle protein